MSRPFSLEQVVGHSLAYLKEGFLWNSIGNSVVPARLRRTFGCFGGISEILGVRAP